VDPKAGLDDVENRKLLTLPGLEVRPLGRPARSQSLYRPRYLSRLLMKTGKITLYINTEFRAQLTQSTFLRQGFSNPKDLLFLLLLLNSFF
jgi:hypothetical protein